MKIAATYDNGNIFQHFGKTEFFKVYEVEDNKVISSEVISSNGTGHGALAGLLAEQGISVLICGGIGGGAQSALAEAGIELCSGAQGDADTAVDAYLKGELVSTGVNCDHHHHEDGHSCGSHEDGHSCGGHEDGHSCGGCGGGCGSQPSITGPNVGKTCRTHYRGTFNDGTQFDSSYDRGEPLEFICGAGQMIKGFDAAVANMEVGQVVDVHLMPEEAYGMPNPDMGKGRFLMDMARLHPERNYVGIEMYDSVLLRALQKREELEEAGEEFSNLVFIRVDARLLPEIFEKDEVDGIYLNFSDPWPKARHAKRRLTSREFLKRYEQVLKKEGTVEFKTDNRGLFEFSLEEVKESDWNLEVCTFDLHHDEELVKGNVMTEYEEKFSSMGNPICKMVIRQK